MYYYKLSSGQFLASIKQQEYPEISQEEYEERILNINEQTKELVKIQEKTRPLTEAEVSRMLITAQINTLVVDDSTALRMKQFYPTWESGIDYTETAGRSVGFKVQHDNNLWKLRQGHTSQTGWEPGKVASLWEQIDEAHAGTLEDPIPYNGNMTLISGKYYAQENIIYLCIRDTGNPVYHLLDDLVGAYVEKI